MSELEKYIESGILESYVLGDTSIEERAQLGLMTAKYPNLLEEINEIEKTLKTYLSVYAVEPPPMHILLQKLFLPELNEKRSIEFWQKTSEKFQKPEEVESVHIEELGDDGKTSTFVAWVNGGVPEEVHDDIFESIFILEGTCECTIDGNVTHMDPGDYMAIPLYVLHEFRVTSPTTLKVILQKSKAA